LITWDNRSENDLSSESEMIRGVLSARYLA